MNYFLCVVLLAVSHQTLGKPNVGFHSSNGDINQYIVNGNDVEKGVYPWMLSLEVVDPLFRHTCGASLLDSRHALTAAHCLDGRFPDMGFRVVYGASNRGDGNTESDREGEVNVTAIILHEDYNCPGCAGAYPNDIAVMYLQEEVTMNEFVQGATLAENGISYEGLDCRASGWGKLDGTEDDVPLKLQDIDIKVLSHADCIENMPVGGNINVQEDVHQCIFDVREDVGADDMRGICQGDSGGPVQCDVDGDGTWHVLGAASWVISGGIGDTCNPSYPGVYAKAVTYLDWIQEKIDDPSWKPES